MNQNHIHNLMITNATIQLYKEFEAICFQYNLKLKKPIIIIEKLLDSFGKWDGTNNKIIISEDLIFQHSWVQVINVLKHEMAHQIVTQIYCSNDSHGDDFIKASERLGLDPFYRKPTLSIKENFSHSKSSLYSEEEAKIFYKIEKLLNLAESSNEHEAFLAMQTVRQIYRKYNIERFTRDIHAKYTSITINLNVKRVPSHLFIIANILQSHFFVSNIFSKIYSVNKNCEYRCLVLMGEYHNVAMAEYVYEFLTQKIQTLWKEYQTKEKVSFKFKISYQRGLLTGFQAKLDAAKQSSSSDVERTELALVQKYAVKLDAYVKTQFPKTTSIYQGGLLYHDHYERGTRDGKQITISRPITEKRQSVQKWLN
jgi:hypothetical protein